MVKTGGFPWPWCFPKLDGWCQGKSPVSSMSTCPVTSPAACHSHHISCTPLNMSGCVGVSFTVCRALHDILNRKLELKSKGMVQNCPKSARRKSDPKTTTQRTSTAPKLPGPIRKLSKATFMAFCEKLTGNAFKLPWFIIMFPIISGPNTLFASSTRPVIGSRRSRCRALLRETGTGSKKGMNGLMV